MTRATWNKLDHLQPLLAGMLAAFGLMTVYSAHADWVRQMLWLAVGCLAYIGAAAFDYRRLRVLAPGLYAAMLVMLIAVHLIGASLLGVLAVLGEYVGRIADECKRRPAYFVKDVFPRATGRALTTTPSAFIWHAKHTSRPPASVMAVRMARAGPVARRSAATRPVGATTGAPDVTSSAASFWRRETGRC